MIAGLLALVVAVAPPAEPLVLDGADHFEVAGRGALVTLSGNVRFHRGDVRFSSRQAVWDRALDQVRFEGDFVLRHPSGSLTARTGRYERSSGSAWAEGDALLLDSAGEVSVRAGSIRYDRNRRIAEARLDPVFRRVEALPGGGSDTVRIQADLLRWKETDSVAEAEGRVRLRRGSLEATCGSAVFDQRTRVLALDRSPRATFGKRALSGRRMRLDVDLARERVDRVTVLDDALGELAGDPDSAGVATSARVRGDTLVAEVDGEVLRHLRVRREARTESWDSRDTARIDRLDGDSLDLGFQDGKMATALVEGRARSFHHWMEGDRLKGVNELEGATIRVAFADGRVRTLRVEGGSQGVWRGTEPHRREE